MYAASESRIRLPAPPLQSPGKDPCLQEITMSIPADHSTPGYRPRRRETCQELNCVTPTLRVWFCVTCGVRLCDGCWNRCAPHRVRAFAGDGLPHEQIDPQVHRLFQRALSEVTAESWSRLYDDDVDTTWFGGSFIIAPHFNRYLRKAQNRSRQRCR